MERTPPTTAKRKKKKLSDKAVGADAQTAITLQKLAGKANEQPSADGKDAPSPQMASAARPPAAQGAQNPAMQDRLAKLEDRLELLLKTLPVLAGGSRNEVVVSPPPKQPSETTRVSKKDKQKPTPKSAWDSDEDTSESESSSAESDSGSENDEEKRELSVFESFEKRTATSEETVSEKVARESAKKRALKWKTARLDVQFHNVLRRSLRRLGVKEKDVDGGSAELKRAMKMNNDYFKHGSHAHEWQRSALEKDAEIATKYCVDVLNICSNLEQNAKLRDVLRGVRDTLEKAVIVRYKAKHATLKEVHALSFETAHIRKKLKNKIRGKSPLESMRKKLPQSDLLKATKVINAHHFMVGNSNFYGQNANGKGRGGGGGGRARRWGRGRGRGGGGWHKGGQQQNNGGNQQQQPQKTKPNVSKAQAGGGAHAQ